MTEEQEPVEPVTPVALIVAELRTVRGSDSQRALQQDCFESTNCDALDLRSQPEHASAPRIPTFCKNEHLRVEIEPVMSSIGQVGRNAEEWYPDCIPGSISTPAHLPCRRDTW